MTGKQALAFVRKHGIVLASAKGPVPNVVDSVAEETVKGSWWGHPKGREIFAVLQQLRESPQILVCRLVEGKITLVHRRLWPALVRVAKYFPARHIAQVHEEHTAAGRHATHDVPFPNWVSLATIKQADKLNDREAFSTLGAWAAERGHVRKRVARKRGSAQA